MSRARLGLLLRALFSAGLIAWLLTRVHWGELVALLRGTHPLPLASGGLLTLAGLLLMAARVRVLLRHWGIVLRFRTAVALTWLGQFCNAFLPGSTGGDVVKFLRVCRLAPEAKTAGFAALVADRLVALAALVLLAGAAVVLGDRNLFTQLANGATLPSVSSLWFSGGVLGLLVVVLLFVAGILLWRGVNQEKMRAWWRPIQAQVALGLRGGSILAGALALALTVHLTSLATYYLFAQALQIHATFGQILLVWPVVMVVTLLPLTVNGYGLRECVLLYYFQHWHLVSAAHPGAGVNDTVIALSLLTVINDFFWSLPGGFCLSVGGPVKPLVDAGQREAFRHELC